MSLCTITPLCCSGGESPAFKTSKYVASYLSLFFVLKLIVTSQGEVREFIVRYNSTLHDGGEGRFTSNTTKWKLNNLYPGTNYQFQLSIDNGAHIVSSQPIFATTDDGGNYLT